MSGQSRRPESNKQQEAGAAARHWALAPPADEPAASVRSAADDNMISRFAACPHLLSRSFFTTTRNSMPVKTGKKLTADQIRAAIDRNDRSLRLTQIPGPPVPLSSSSFSSSPGTSSKSDLLNSARQAYEWECVKDIRMSYEMMYELLMQRDVRLKREKRFSHCNPAQRHSGWALFLSDFSKHMQHKKKADHDADREPQVNGLPAMHSLVKQASESWKQLGKEERAQYNQRAKLLSKQQAESDLEKD